MMTDVEVRIMTMVVASLDQKFRVITGMLLINFLATAAVLLLVLIR